MEIQTLLKKLGNTIEEKNNLLCMENQELDFNKIKLELDIAIDNYNTLFSALPMLM